MLTEGWDARTVTHIMGLRAFSSQLLCEQVVGRGLRRTAYELDPATGLFPPEHVNIFGIPFTFLPHEGGDDVAAAAAAAQVADRGARRRGDSSRSPGRTWCVSSTRGSPRLTLDLDARAGAAAGRLGDGDSSPSWRRWSRASPTSAASTEIDLEDLGDAASGCRRSSSRRPRDVFDQMAPDMAGGREVLIAQLVPLVEALPDL